MTASLAGLFNLQILTDTGAPADGYRLYTYEASTTTHKAAYVTPAADVSHVYTSDGIGGQYITLNARGELDAPLFITPGAYDVVLKTAAGAAVWTRRASYSADGIDGLVVSGGAELVGCVAAGAGAVLRTVQDKLRDEIHAKDYGAVGTGDETVKLKALFDAAIPLGRTVVLTGNYTVSGPISTVTAIAEGALHVRCDGDVTITVDSGAAAFLTLLACYTTAAHGATITGGRLSINGNNKVGNGIYLRHHGQGGHVVIDNLRIVNIKNVNAGASENQALLISGRYRAIDLGVVDVDTVDRSGSGTATKGITISEIEGPCTARVLRIRNVLSTGFSGDADGIYLGGYTAGTQYSQRAGSYHIDTLEIDDCQGRSIKGQHQDVTITNCIIRRQSVSTFDLADVDFQMGGGQIENLQCVYKKSGATSLIHANFYPISLQQQCTDMPNRFRIGNVNFRAEMQLIRLVFVTIGSGSLAGTTEVSNVTLQPLGAMSGSHFSRALVEFDAGQAAASSNTTHIAIRNCRGDMAGVPLLGHATFGASLAAKLSWDITGNTNTGTFSANNRIVGPVSGNGIPAVLGFMCRDNAGFTDTMMIGSGGAGSGWTFDYQTLPIGCRFHYDLATGNTTNAPGALGASGFALVEALGAVGATAGYRSVRVTKDNAAAANTVFQTQTGTWGIIK